MQFNTADLLTFLIGFGLPLLVGLVTTKETNASLKSYLLLALSAVTSVLTQVLDATTTHTPFMLWPTVYGALGAFVVGVGAHLGLWKQSGASGALQAVGSKAPTSPVSPVEDKWA